jgi:N-acetylglutamate synthase-like GNAT family acetyltransferase
MTRVGSAAIDRNRGVASLLLEVAVHEASRCSRELFVYTDRREWYEQRGWSLVREDPDAPFVVLRRST